jgi:hypothetical protein
MAENLRLPEKIHFQKGGIFHKCRIQYSKPLPLELLTYIFPDYSEIIFKQKAPIKEKTLRKVREYCLATKKLALKEEQQQREIEKKQIETRELEEKIRIYFNNYYQNLYKNCTCNIKNNQ